METEKILNATKYLRGEFSAGIFLLKAITYELLNEKQPQASQTEHDYFINPQRYNSDPSHPSMFCESVI